MAMCINIWAEFAKGVLSAIRVEEPPRGWFLLVEFLNADIIFW
jgi:hypothetical protein